MTTKQKSAHSKDAAALSKRIEAIKTKATSLGVEVHQCAIACVVHTLKHGDWTPVQQLCEALGKGSVRVGALRIWLIKWGPFTFDPATKSRLKLKTRGAGSIEELKAAYTKDPEAFAKELEGEAPWDLKGNEASQKPFDLKAELAKVFKKAERAKDKDGSRLYGIENPKAIADKIKDFDNEGLQAVFKFTPMAKPQVNTPRRPAAQEPEHTVPVH